MSMQGFLQVSEVGQGDSKTNFYSLPIRRETSNFYVTDEGFTHGIVGLTSTQRNKKIVHWSKATNRRQGDSDCHYTHSFEVRGVVAEADIPAKAIRI